MADGLSVIINSRHLSGLDVPQQLPSRNTIGLVHVWFGEAERSTLKLGVMLSQFCPKVKNV